MADRITARFPYDDDGMVISTGAIRLEAGAVVPVTTEAGDVIGTATVDESENLRGFLVVTVVVDPEAAERARRAAGPADPAGPGEFSFRTLDAADIELVSWGPDYYGYTDLAGRDKP